jgi:thiol-disulfide isomerase/thioredoxin
MALFTRHFGRVREHLSANWKSHVRTLVVAAVVLLGVQAWQTRGVPSGLAPNVNLVIVQPDGISTQSTLNQWRALHPGKPVALHFWADWCPICRTEENSITRLSEDWPVLTVAMQSGPPDNVSKVLRKRELPWNTGVDESGDAAVAFGFKAVPAFVVVDANGRLRAPTVGYTTEIGMRLRLWWASLVPLWKH